MLRIGIAGIDGRMGREIVAAAAGEADLVVAGGIGRPGFTREGEPRVFAELDELVPLVDVVIDFSTPSAVPGHVLVCRDGGRPYVCGVTGLDDAQLGTLHEAAARIPVFYARNMSLGIAAILAILPGLSAELPEYDAEIVELHHRRKIDAPSGTALALGEAVAAGRGADLAEAAVHGRSGIAPRVAGEIGFHSLRGGGNAGEHIVLFASEGEEIRVSHRALSRRTFAAGALRAARFTAGQTPGFYQMADLFKTRSSQS